MNPVKIVYRIDKDCEMECLEVNDHMVGFGNMWDDHCRDRLDAIIQTMNILKIPYYAAEDDKWSYEDEQLL